MGLHQLVSSQMTRDRHRRTLRRSKAACRLAGSPRSQQQRQEDSSNSNKTVFEGCLTTWRSSMHGIKQARLATLPPLGTGTRSHGHRKGVDCGQRT